MSTRGILQYPNPLLRQRALTVERFDEDLEGLIADMLETMYQSRAIGLAAPQVGAQRQVLVLDVSEDQTAPFVFINPVIVSRRLPGLVDESCLSLPGLEGRVKRALRVRVRFQTALGAWLERDLEDMQAIALQHEMDHLRGILFLDRLPWWKRWAYRRQTRAIPPTTPAVPA